MNMTAFRAPMTPDPTTGTAGTTPPAATACLIEPSGLAQDEICQIVPDLIG